MSHTLILTVCAPDRPGIMSRISGIVKDSGANWLESRMARLGGQFAGIVRVDCQNEPSADALEKALAGLCPEGIQVDCHTEGDVAKSPFARCLKIDISGNDRTGIVSQITKAISQVGANVEELNTCIENVSATEPPVFHASGSVCLPESTGDDQLVDMIESLSDDLNVEISQIS